MICIFCQTEIYFGPENRLTSELYAKDREPTNVKEAQGAAKTREGRTECMGPLAKRIFVFLVVFSPFVLPAIQIPLSVT